MGEEIRMEEVLFAYEADREILHGVTMGFPSGSFTAIVGESGSGKSTIGGILMGRNRGYTGKVLVGETPLERIREESLLKNVTYVGHQSYLFKGTVAENLRMAAPDASDEALWAVLERVKLAAFLRSEQGLNTQLQEKGSNFSGRGSASDWPWPVHFFKTAACIFLTKLPPISMWRAKTIFWRKFTLWPRKRPW